MLISGRVSFLNQRKLCKIVNIPSTKLEGLPPLGTEHHLQTIDLFMDGHVVDVEEKTSSKSALCQLFIGPPPAWLGVFCRQKTPETQKPHGSLPHILSHYGDLEFDDLHGRLKVKGNFISITLPETNMFAPENRPGPKRKRSYSNHPFPGATLFSGRVYLKCLLLKKHFVVEKKRWPSSMTKK